MSNRYLTNAALGLSGGFLIVASRVFVEPTVEWLALAIGVAAIALSAGIVLKGRGRTQRILDVATVAAGAWTIVETLIFGSTTNLWLAFASGAAFVALALAGLTAHELSTERVVHSIEVSNHEGADREYAHAA